MTNKNRSSFLTRLQTRKEKLHQENENVCAVSVFNFRSLTLSIDPVKDDFDNVISYAVSFWNKNNVRIFDSVPLLRIARKQRQSAEFLFDKIKQDLKQNKIHSQLDIRSYIQ